MENHIIAAVIATAFGGVAGVILSSKRTGYDRVGKVKLGLGVALIGIILAVLVNVSF